LSIAQQLLINRTYNPNMAKSAVVSKG